MATTKGKKVKEAADTRPTLEEIKSQPGRNLFVTYEGTEGGGWSIPALRPRFPGDIPEELMIVPWEPKLIAEDWLDDIRFREIYMKFKGVKVFRSDVYPKKPDLKLPDDLDRSVNPSRKQMAQMLAMSEYGEPQRDVVNMKFIDVSPLELAKWENDDLYPFLEVFKFYEERLLNRKEVLRDINARMAEIDKSTFEENRRYRFNRGRSA